MYIKRFFLVGLVLAFAFNLTGCITAKPPLYSWGKYPDDVYERYVTHEDAQADAHLIDTITNAEQKSQKVPPGAYAVYGYQLFKRGDKPGALVYFEKEKRAFPESSLFMNKLIEKASPTKAVLNEKETDLPVPTAKFNNKNSKKAAKRGKKS